MKIFPPVSIRASQRPILDLPVSQRAFSCLFAKVLIIGMCKLIAYKCKRP